VLYVSDGESTLQVTAAEAVGDPDKSELKIKAKISPIFFTPKYSIKSGLVKAYEIPR
jgi:hypothetical protein